MAMLDFLQAVRAARNAFVHEVNPTDSMNLHDPDIQRSRAPIWLASSVVKDFDPADFVELNKDNRQELEATVKRYKKIAENFDHKRGKISQEQMREAIATFLQLVKIIEHFIENGEEAEELRHLLESLNYPKGIVTWEFETGFDSTGDPALWIWIFVDEKLARRKDITDVTMNVQRQIQEALAKSKIVRWPYVHVRSVAEQRSLVQQKP